MDTNYTREDLVALLSYLEDTPKDILRFNTFRRLMRCIQYNSTKNSELILAAIRSEDYESYKFLIQVEYKDLPLYVNDEEWKIKGLCIWRLQRGV